MDVLEGGIRVPFAVQWTGRLPAHVVYDDLVSSLDIVATAAAAAGISLPTDRVYDGLNIVPYWRGNRSARCEHYSGVSSVSAPMARRDPHPLSIRFGPCAAARSSWSLKELKTTKPPALYNLLSDIGETQNLAASQPAAVRSLTRLYAQWTLDTIPAYVAEEY